MPAKVHHIKEAKRQQKAKEPQKRGRKPPPPGETARDRFVRIGNKRMENALTAISLLGNLSSPIYGWTPEDLERMNVALLDAIEKAFARFEMQKKPEKVSFRFG